MRSGRRQGRPTKCGIGSTRSGAGGISKASTRPKRLGTARDGTSSRRTRTIKNGAPGCEEPVTPSSGGCLQMFVSLARSSLLLLSGHADCAACLVTGPSGLGQMQGRAADGRSSPAQNSSHSRSGGHSSSERSSGGRIQMCVLHARLSILRLRDRVDRAAGASSATEEGQAHAKSGSPAPSVAGVGRGCARRYATRLPRRLCCEGGGTRRSSR